MEYRVWRKRNLSEARYAYIWADGVNFSVRLKEDNLKCLVIVGVTESGDKEIIALEGVPRVGGVMEDAASRVETPGLPGAASGGW